MPIEVQIKGIREGLLVSFGAGDWPDLETALLEEIDRQADFLKGAKIVLDVEEHALGAATLGKLRDQIADRGLLLWAVLTNSEATERTAQALGLATRIHQGEPAENGSNAVPPEHEGILVRRNLRSGANLSFPGHITVIGDVNPGAQIVAGGDVVVWGRLRGTVHAGAEGDENAVVCAMDLAPIQLRIAGHIATSPEQQAAAGPEMALVRDGQVVAEAWRPMAAQFEQE
jgi:septum site-determining protein MinC